MSAKFAILRAPFAALVILLSVVTLPAQDTRGGIHGRVLDPQSSAVVGATVRVINVDTNTALPVRTNETGYYEANLLLPGCYQVTAEAPGFKKTVRSGIVLAVGASVQVDVSVELGGVTETVSVTEDAPLLETNTVSSGLVMENRSINDLPVARTNPMLLLGFTPGLQERGGYRTTAHLAATILVENLYLPNKVGQNELLIDGVPNIGLGRRVAYVPNTEALQEFKIETSGFDPSLGHTLGASIAMMTKGGGNAFHGSLTDQHLQQRWNATPFFIKQAYYRSIAQANGSGNRTLADYLRSQDPQRSGRSNNYSGIIGGPVILPKVIDGRNKLFFFLSFNGTNDRLTDNRNINSTLPTLANRRGDFSQLLLADAVRFQVYDPLTTRADPARASHYIRDPIPGNILPPSRVVNPVYNPYNKLLPIPNNESTDPTRQPIDNYVATGMPWNYNYYAVSNRIDYQLSSKHRFFARWSWDDYAEHAADFTYDSAPGLHDQDLVRHNVGATVDWVYAIGPSTVLDIAVSANEYRQISALEAVAKTYKPSDVGLPAYLDAKAGNQLILPTMTLPGYRNLGRPFNTFQRGRTMALKSDLSHIWNKHTLRTGFDSRQYYQTGGAGGNTSGTFTFNNQYTRRNDDTLTPAGDLGLTWAAFMMGVPSAMTVDTTDSYAMHSPAYGWYFQDSWRLTSKLTINLGLRMEYEQGPNERYNRTVSYFDRSAALPISQGAQAAYARSPIPELPASNFLVQGGTVYPGSGGAPRNLFKNELMWMPRVSVAYQLNSKTVLRGGYGSYYDTLNAGYIGPNQLGFSRTTSTNITDDFGTTWLVGDPKNGISPLRDPFPVRSDGTRFDAPVRDGLGPMAAAGASFSARAFDTNHPRQQRWRVGVQRQLGGSQVIEVAYAGAYSDRVFVARPIDPLPSQYWGSGLVRDNAGASNLTTNVTNPFFLGNFTSLKSSNPAVYQYMSTLGFFTGPTIQKQQLLRAYPQMTRVTTSTDPSGEARSHELEVSYSRRFSKGLNLNVGYTRLHARQADFFSNEYDASPTWRETNFGAPNRFTATSLVELPFGKGRRWLQSGLLSKVAGGFQVGATYEFQTGALLDWGNLFYYGKLQDIGGVPNQTLDRWFNTDNFERNAAKAPAAFQQRVFPTRVDGVRAQIVNDWNLNLTREFRLTERWKIQFRFDAINALNHTVFGPPETNTLSSNFGRVTTATETPNRGIYGQVRIQF